jgi:hypothetical protein
MLRLLLHLVPTGVLLFVLAVVLLRDVLVDAPRAQAIVEEDKQETVRRPKSEPVYAVQIDDDEPAPAVKAQRLPIEPTPYIRYEYNGMMRYGMTVLRDHNGRELRKLITYSPRGDTSDTRLKIDGAEVDYGSFGGQWLDRDKKLPDDPETEAFGRSQSTFVVKDIHVTQILEIVPSQQPVQVNGQAKRVLDTVVVRYIVENKGSMARTVGLRAHVDTLIGSNDGVPFTVPGRGTDRGLINTFADYTSAEQVPPFLQALEYADLQNPGTVAHMTLKLGGKVEPPSRVSLTYWPGGGARYDVPIRNFSVGRPDSAVIIYWLEKPMQPGERRELGFAYGLGAVEAQEGKGKLALTLAGAFEPGKTFTISAYVHNPVAGQTATLTVPAGLEVQGETTQAVPAPLKSLDTSLVTWQARVVRTGKYRLEVKTSNGLSQAKTITIQQPDSRSDDKGSFRLVFKGDIAPQKVFTVTAVVTDAVPGQKLTLTLPRQLETSDPLTRSVPTGAKAEVSWQVRVNDVGSLPIRVESSTGLVRVRTIVLKKKGSESGIFGGG